MTDWNPTTLLQFQPCATSCLSTCVAMILNQPVAAVVDKVHRAYHDTMLSVADILSGYGVAFESFSTADRHTIDRSGLWLLGVPSLNIEGGLHAVLVEYDDESCQWVIFDPRQGAEGKKYYSANPGDEPLARKLSGFSTDAFISLEELARLRGRQL